MSKESTKYLLIPKLLNEHGFTVIPVNELKQPMVGWAKYLNRAQTQEDVVQEFTYAVNKSKNGTYCGPAVLLTKENQLQVLDFEERNNLDQEPLFNKWAELVNNHDPDLYSRLVIDKTNNAGYHVFFYSEHSLSNANATPLAFRELTEQEKNNIRQDRNIKEGQKETIIAKGKMLAEVLQAGHLCTIYPYPGYGHQHQDENKRRLFQGKFSQVPKLTQEELTILTDAARLLGTYELPVKELPQPTTQQKPPKQQTLTKEWEGKSTPDDYEERHTVMEVLESNGWTLIKDGKTRKLYRRPGATNQAKHDGAAELKNGVWLFTNYSTSETIEGKYGAFRLYVYFKYGGTAKDQINQACKDLYALGYGDRQQKTSHKTDGLVKHPLAQKGNNLPDKKDKNGPAKEEKKAINFFLNRQKFFIPEISQDAFHKIMEPRIAPKVYEHLPECLKPIIELNSYKIGPEITLLSMLTACSGLMPKIYFTHRSTKTGEGEHQVTQSTERNPPNLYFGLIAPNGQQKSGLNVVKECFKGLKKYRTTQFLAEKKEMQERLENAKGKSKALRKEKREILKNMQAAQLAGVNIPVQEAQQINNRLRGIDDELERLSNAEEEARPYSSGYRITLMPPNFTAASFMDDAEVSGGAFCIRATECKTLVESVHSKYGNLSAELRDSWHGDELGKRIKHENTYKQVHSPRFSVLASGTPDQWLELIPNTEDGLYSRFLFMVGGTDPETDESVFEDDTLETWGENEQLRQYAQFDRFFTDKVFKILERIPGGVRIMFKHTDETRAMFKEFALTRAEELLAIHPGLKGRQQRELVMVKKIACVLTVLRQAELLQHPSQFTPDEYGARLLCDPIDFVIALHLVESYAPDALLMYQVFQREETIEKARRVNAQIITDVEHVMAKVNELKEVNALSWAEILIELRKINLHSTFGSVGGLRASYSRWKKRAENNGTPKSET